jgi:ankyrin repeat protein
MGNTHDVSLRHPSSIQTSFSSITPLYDACRDGNEEQVRKLLPNYSHEDLNQQEHINGGNTCLHIAAANGRDNIVKLLL